MYQVKIIMRKRKKPTNSNAESLLNIDEPLYDVIINYGIGHNYLASKLYPQEWDDSNTEEGKATRKMLTGRLRNKLDGKGKLMPNEYSDLISIISEIATSADAAVKGALAKKNKFRKEKIARFLETADEETIEELKKML